MRPSRSNSPADRSPASRTDVAKAVRHQGERLLLHDRQEAIPHHLEVDLPCPPAVARTGTTGAAPGDPQGEVSLDDRHVA